MAVSEEELAGVLRLCDPAQTGLVSLDYFTQLASQHAANPEEAERLVRRLDARGRGYLSYQEFCLGVSTILRQSGGKERMMAPSVGQRNLAGNDSTDYITPPSEKDSNGKSNSSRCSSLSDGESFECYGEVEMDTSLSNHINGNENRLTNGNSLKRNTWLRTSLKRSSNNHENLPNRRWGSFRQSGKRLGPSSLGSPLNRSSSFNSSGRSSACDTGDDVYSDASLEEDVLDLNHKVQMLQQQMSVLADNQTHSDERYTRAKQDNATLQARVLMLEEQLREVETRSEEKLAEQERRHKELVARVDREKQLQVENCAIRLQTLELENSSLRDEAGRYKAASERLKAEASRLEDQLGENEAVIASLKEEIATLREQERRSRETLQSNQQLVEELSEEIERLRGEQRRALAELDSRAPGICPSEHENLQAQFMAIKEENARLQEAHDEMQALLLTRSVEEGRSLLTGHQSLAAELEAMTQDEPAGVYSKDDVTEVRLALKEQQEVNAQLRGYIDGILLNIVDNYPQLLEVKPAPP